MGIKLAQVLGNTLEGLVKMLIPAPQLKHSPWRNSLLGVKLITVGFSPHKQDCEILILSYSHFLDEKTGSER